MSKIVKYDTSNDSLLGSKFLISSSSNSSYNNGKKKKANNKTSAPFFRKNLPPSPIVPERTIISINSQNNRSYDSIVDISESTSNNNNDNIDTSTQSALNRHLSLIDLLAVGIGGTIGSGLFVLVGLVIHEYAGPGAIYSWILAGIAAIISGTCYAELSGRIPLPGSAYAYAYTSMGELPAILAASCLSLEYIVASSAVARSWGDKMVVYIRETTDINEYDTLNTMLGTHESFFNLFAFIISTGIVILLLQGIHESKQVTNIFTFLKVSLVIFMILYGLYNINTNNYTPFIPTEFNGINGILRGSSSVFFGYLGYDQICGLAGETIYPKRDLPRAILLTLVGVTSVYILATIALCGMESYVNISSVSGFPVAFQSLNLNIAAQITSIGEIITLPIVLLVTVQVQPRLQYAMAEDGLISIWFKQLDNKGNLWNGTCSAGIILIIFSTFVPFIHLNDIISCAVLSALIITNTSLILMWHENPLNPYSRLPEYLLLLYHISAISTAIVITKVTTTTNNTDYYSSAGKILTMLTSIGMIVSCYSIYKLCPRSERFGGKRQHYHGEQVKVGSDGYFRAPFVPFLPCLGIFINYYLIVQLDFTGIAGLLFIWLLVIIYYFFFAVHHSIGGIAEQSERDEGDVLLSQRSIS